MGHRTIIARYVAKWGIAQMCLCETKYQGGVSHHFGGAVRLPEKVSRDMGYRSDSIAVSRDMGPLRARHEQVQNWKRTHNHSTPQHHLGVVAVPEGLKIKKIRSRPSWLKILSDRSWIEIFDRALFCTPRGPGNRNSRIEIFDRA